MQNRLKVGVARGDITPPLGTLLMGYPDPYGERKAEKIRDPLNATALVFESDGERSAIVQLDIALLEDIHVQAIRQEIAEKTPVPAANIAVCAIQTHSAPRTQKVWGWCDLDLDYIEKILIPNAVKAVVKACASPLPVRVGIATIYSEVGVNRRNIGLDHEIKMRPNPWAPIDPQMTVLRFESASGTLANLVHYGAHPTIFNSRCRVISRDWPGIMIDRMEHLTGATTLYLNGAVGDIAPRSNSNSAVGDGDGEAALWETGSRASMDAMQAWRSIKDMRDVDMHCLVDSFEMPYRPLPPIEESRQELKACTVEKDQPGPGMANYHYWKAVVKAHDSPPRTGKPYQQVIISLGPVAIVPFPGEPFAETVLRLREWSPFQYTLCSSTSCGNNGYFPTRESRHRGGYEVWFGRALGPYLLAENIDDVLVEENLKRLKRLHTAAVPLLEGSKTE